MKYHSQTEVQVVEVACQTEAPMKEVMCQTDDNPFQLRTIMMSKSLHFNLALFFNPMHDVEYGPGSASRVELSLMCTQDKHPYIL